ncbi:hypothetical protein FIBSPDRAFT_954551 [Athelia psychrophila]|uniref:Cyclin N-terminal domain-containing protein n=1 Tax=Athelia psychrophila TaxID=1759441 RepID=A0A166J1L7_9AGAM|nr:hypothetical protein FIBSPDRAFT_954551 [Fibularhizoctonia sp. CBS 109695]
MATAHGPVYPTHPTAFQAPASRMAHHPGPSSSAKPPASTPPSKPDPYYGHEHTTRLCGRFITHLFACPEYPPTSCGLQTKLPHFIAYALHRTKLHTAVTFAALVLLQRLKARFPTAGPPAIVYSSPPS